MQPPEPDIGIRDLLRHLPDLLSGREPALASPEWRRRLATDDEVRLAVASASAVVQALSAGEPRLSSGSHLLRAGIPRSLAAARRHFRGGLADTLRNAGLAYLVEATKSRLYLTGLSAVAQSPVSRAHHAELCDQLRTAFGWSTRDLETDRLLNDLAVTASPSSEAGYRALAVRCLSAAVDLVPTEPATRFYLMVARYLDEPASAAAEWARFARDLMDRDYRGHAFGAMAYGQVELGRFAAASPLYAEAARHRPHSAMIAFNQMLTALLLGDRSAAATAHARFDRSFAGLAHEIAGYQVAIRGQREEWRAIWMKQPSLVESVVCGLPQALAAAIKEHGT